MKDPFTGKEGTWFRFWGRVGWVRTSKKIVQFARDAGSFQPRNVGNGNVAGLEIELRKHLGFIAPALSNLFFQTNLTFTKSVIEMSETEYQSKLANARENETVKDTRAMAGQAPYILNGGLIYSSESGFEAGAFYNVQGRTLQFAGIVDRPDVYTVPFHSLNLTVNKTFGSSDQSRIGLKVTNLLNDRRESVFSSYEATDQLFQSLAPGRQISVNFSYSL